MYFIGFHTILCISYDSMDFTGFQKMIQKQWTNTPLSCVWLLLGLCLAQTQWPVFHIRTGGPEEERGQVLGHMGAFMLGRLNRWRVHCLFLFLLASVCYHSCCHITCSTVSIRYCWKGSCNIFAYATFIKRSSSKQ